MKRFSIYIILISFNKMEKNFSMNKSIYQLIAMPTFLSSASKVVCAFLKSGQRKGLTGFEKNHLDFNFNLLII